MLARVRAASPAGGRGPLMRRRRDHPSRRRPEPTGPAKGMPVAGRAAAELDRHDRSARTALQIARMYLEWERGLRPATSLKALLAPHVYEQMHSGEIRHRRGRGAVATGDLGCVHLQVLPGGRVDAVISVHESPGQRSGLLLTVDRDLAGDSRISMIRRADDVARLRVRPAPAPHRPTPDDLADWRDGVTALRRWLAEAGPACIADPTNRRRLAAVRGAHRRLAVLDTRIAVAERALATAADRTARRTRALGDAAAYGDQVHGLLGRPPASEAARRTYDQAVVAILRYTTEWNVDPITLALGGPPASDDQRADRAQALAAINEAHTARRDEQRQVDTGRTIDEPAGLELD